MNGNSDVPDGEVGSLALVNDGPWAGWLAWKDRADGTFVDALGCSHARSDQPGRATVMLDTAPTHGNLSGALHGGFVAGFADHAYFAGLRALGRPEQVFGTTIDLSMQFIDAGRIGVPLRADVELLRETGRLLFMRLTIWQEDRLIATSTTTVRKARKPE